MSKKGIVQTSSVSTVQETSQQHSIGGNEKFKELYFISFIEGGLVMVAELAGAKLLTPYFGASLYSWAGTLSITLLALMLGYYFGGYLTLRKNFFSRSKIAWALLISGLTVAIMPTTATLIMQKTINLSFFPGLIFSQLCFLFPPIFLMGMISPMIIYQITEKASQSGRSAGNIYALSTFGGILFTLLFGFIIIPDYGISSPVRVLGLLVSSIAIFILVRSKTAVVKVASVVAAILSIGYLFSLGIVEHTVGNATAEVIDESEGLLGELKITDELMYTPAGMPFYTRKLNINNVSQNYVVRDTPQISLLYYVDFTKHLLHALPPKKSGLLVGLGAGSLYAIMKNEGMDVESVEIDQRMYDFGIKYFKLPPHSNHTITDGRYFINTVKKKYDLVVLDVIIGENIAGQLLTLESFRKCRELLNDDGMLIVEHGGVWDIKGSMLIPSVIKTLKAANFEVSIYNPLMSDERGDILFIATKQKLSLLRDTFPNDYLMQGRRFKECELPVSEFERKPALVLTDDKNNSEVLLKSHYFQIRDNFRKSLSKNLF